MKDWLGNTILSIAGGVVIILLMMLNAYIQRLARSEEEQRLELLRSERLKRERSAASQSRRPDDIWRPGCLWNSACLPSDSGHTCFPRILPTVQNLTPSPPSALGYRPPAPDTIAPQYAWLTLRLVQLLGAGHYLSVFDGFCRYS